ncbi:MAG: YigZ family protein [Bacteroidota bacterium]
MFDDTFKTISTPSEGLYKEKGSKFIGYAYPVKSEAEVKDLVAKLKKEHHSARHHCYAFRLLPDKSVFRSNDDGEPSGTAGKPILGQILSNDLTNVLVVVVRYFGGTLLGVSGLIKAYKTAAAEAIANAEIITKTIDVRYEITCSYIQLNDVMRIIKQENIQVISQQSSENSVLIIELRKSMEERSVALFRKLDGIGITNV